MGQQQNQKLIAVTGIGSGDSKGHGGFFTTGCSTRFFSAQFMTIRTAKKPSSRQAMWNG
jgi:hypothetical protein